MFVSPLFDLANMTLFADDNYVLHSNKQKEALLLQMKNTLEKIIKWLKQSGLKVNDAKTEFCLFYRKDSQPVKLNINNIELTSVKSMKVLGVLFDSKLNWQSHLQLAITKSKKALQAIKMIKKYFTKGELLTLLISNYYSILYYNAEIWLIPSLTRQAKTHLYSASANPLKMCYPLYDSSVSFERLHSITKRPPPESTMKFKHALLLHKTYNSTEPNKEWTDIFFNQHFNARSNTVNFFDTSKFKQGKNLLCNRFVCINKKITYDSLNLPYSKFKTHAKSIFLT